MCSNRHFLRHHIVMLRLPIRTEPSAAATRHGENVWAEAQEQNQGEGSNLSFQVSVAEEGANQITCKLGWPYLRPSTWTTRLNCPSFQAVHHPASGGFDNSKALLAQPLIIYNFTLMMCLDANSKAAAYRQFIRWLPIQ